MNPEEKFKSLMREGRPAPALPPRFQENVWRRIESATASDPSASWLAALATLFLRPRFACAAAAALLLAGVLAGAIQGRQAARHDAQRNYLAAVAPQSLR